MANSGQFLKGVPPWNKGKKGYMGANRTSFQKGWIPWNKDKEVPQMQGENHPNFGRRYKWSERQRLSLRSKRDYKKENHPNWIADRSSLVQSELKHLDGRYREWMFSVKLRDGWKCKINNSDCNGRLESHHILNWKDFPELRYETNNGITLCHAHHPRGRKQEAELTTYFQKLVGEVR